MPGAAGGASFLPSWLRSSPGRGGGKKQQNNNTSTTNAGVGGSKVMAAPAPPTKQQGGEERPPSAGVAAYNVTQLTALREHVASTALGLPATATCASLRTSNEALLAQLDKEIARQGSLLLAAQSDAFGSDTEDDTTTIGTYDGATRPQSVIKMALQPLPSTEDSHSGGGGHNQAVARHFMLAQQARLAAQLEVRNAEAAAYVEHRAKVKARRVQALTRRLACYIVALMLLVAGFSTFLAVPAAHGILLFFVITLALAMVFVIMGYIYGESWRLRAASERELRKRVEKRAEEILAEFTETYRVQQEEERRRLEEQRQREAAEEERRKEAERIADEELLRSIEAGKTRRNRYGKGSVSSTDIKLPDASSSCCEETTLHAGVNTNTNTNKPTSAEPSVAIEDSEAAGQPLVIPNKTTPRSAHAAVRRWFVGRVFGAGAGVDDGRLDGEESKAEATGSVWV